MKNKNLIIILVIVVAVIILGFIGYSNTCSKFPYPCGKCEYRIFGITFMNKFIECASQSVGGCGGVYYIHWNECCQNWAEENNIAHASCVGNWTVEDNTCNWVCSN